jgi:hypothetical protein
MPATPVRNIRVPDDLWNRVKHKAWMERTDVTAVVVGFLESYADGVTLADIPEVPDMEPT